ncbi:MAG: ATP-binding protein [Rhodospirillales bacterium]
MDYAQNFDFGPAGLEAKAEARLAALTMLAAAAGTQDVFLQTAIKALAIGMDCPLAAIGELNEEGNQVNLRCMYRDGRFVEPYSCNLAGTPCAEVYASTNPESHVFCGTDLADRFPEDSMLLKMGAQSYRAEAFHNGEGRRIGHVFIADTKPRLNDDVDTAFFRLVSQRIGAEINRWHADKAQKQQRLILQTVVDNLPMPITLCDSDSRYILANRKFAEWHGLDLDGVVGNLTADVLKLSPDECAKRKELAHFVMTTGKVHQREEIRLFADGPERYVIISKFPVRDDTGTVVGFGSTGVDITSQRDSEKALRKAKERAETASRAKSEFLANMSHELRTPLNSVIGLSEIMLEGIFGPVSGKYREYITDINVSGQHLLEVISDILDISKIEAGEVDLEESPIDIPGIVRASLRLAYTRTQDKRKWTSINIPEGFPMLKADKRLVRQVLVNLLTNAIKFTDDDGEVGITAEIDDQGGIALRVVDTGIGIASDDIPRALEPFGQVRRRPELTHEGTGLGLPLSRKFMNLHGGTLELMSEPNKGTTVIITFPAARTVHP